MIDKETLNLPQKRYNEHALRNWTMTLLTLIFVLLYMMALLGWLKPLSDEKMVLQLEPIIFVIIGYYFGRLPGYDNEKTLQEEITRQTRKADAVQHAKEQAQQISEVMEEKLKNIKAALTHPTPKISAKAIAETTNQADSSTGSSHLHHSVTTALNIIDS